MPLCTKKQARAAVYILTQNVRIQYSPQFERGLKSEPKKKDTSTHKCICLRISCLLDLVLTLAPNLRLLWHMHAFNPPYFCSQSQQPPCTDVLVWSHEPDPLFLHVEECPSVWLISLVCALCSMMPTKVDMRNSKS